MLHLVLQQRTGACSALWGGTCTELSSQWQHWLLIEISLRQPGLKRQCTKLHSGYLEQIPRCIMTRLTWESKKYRSIISHSEKVGICSLWQEKGKRCVHLPAPRAISTPTWSYSEAPGYKGQPKNSSAMTHPNDHISIASQKGKPRMISGALQRKRSENISKGSRAAQLVLGSWCPLWHSQSCHQQVSLLWQSWGTRWSLALLTKHQSVNI